VRNRKRQQADPPPPENAACGRQKGVPKSQEKTGNRENKSYNVPVYPTVETEMRQVFIPVAGKCRPG